jgi:hypothetical protein
MATETYVKSGGVWRESTAIGAKTSGTWRDSQNVYVKDGGVWRLVFQKVTSLSATGGTVTTPGDGYKYHTFTGPGSLVVASAGPGAIEYLAIGGGGGGGNGGDSSGGGGGAGGLVYNSSYTVTATTYPFGVGGGGGAATAGSPTTAFGITALGGGFGSSRTAPGGPGGCGGGSGAYTGGPGNAGPGIQPSQNPGVPNLTQYGNPGIFFPNPGPTGNAGPGGSANAPNDRNINATFPNSSTILSGSPIGPQAIGRGGQQWIGPTTSAWPGTSYGSGGNGSAGTGGTGISGAIIVRYPV